MKLATPYKCDYCGKLKGESNHWWLKLPQPDHPVPRFELFPWNEALNDAEGVEHICSQECASKALSKWMSGIVKI